jgi:hypothetical protein
LIIIGTFWQKGAERKKKKKKKRKKEKKEVKSQPGLFQGWREVGGREIFWWWFGWEGLFINMES